MTVIIMEPARALSADFGSHIFGRVKGGRITTVGIRTNKNRVDNDVGKSITFPLSTKYSNHDLDWPLPLAKRMFGFCEVM